MAQRKISPDMTVAQLLKKYPELVRVFKKLRMDCPHCKGRESETLAWVARMHGKKPQELIKILEQNLKGSK